MEYITLKNSNLKVSRFQMGGCPMGGYGWGDTNEQDFLNAINLAIENGVNFFDTADTYGLGQSEITLAKGIKGKREKVVIQLTKNFEFIAEYESAKQAEKCTKAHATHIGDSCKSKATRTAGGFRWMYKNDYEEYVRQKQKD